VQASTTGATNILTATRALVHAAAKDFLRIAIVETVDAFLNFMRCIRDAYDGNPVQHLIDIYLSPP
jgi:hypothetical protein